MELKRLSENFGVQLREEIKRITGSVAGGCATLLRRTFLERRRPVYQRADVTGLVPPEQKFDGAWYGRLAVAGVTALGGIALLGSRRYDSAAALGALGVVAYGALTPEAGYKRSADAAEFLNRVLHERLEERGEGPVQVGLTVMGDGKVEVKLRVEEDEGDTAVAKSTRLTAFQRRWIAEAKLQFPICKVSTAQRAAVATWLRCKIQVDKPDIRAVDLLAHVQRITTAYFVTTAEEILQAQVLQDAEVRDRLRLIALADA